MFAPFHPLMVKFPELSFALYTVEWLRLIPTGEAKSDISLTTIVSRLSEDNTLYLHV